MSKEHKAAEKFLLELSDAVVRDCQATWDLVPMDLYEPQEYEVVTALIARQGSLAIDLALNPNVWTVHSAPLFHRAMSDVMITLSYILAADSKERAKEFMLFGLGQEKLAIAHLEARLQEHPDDEATKTMVEARKAWLEFQRMADLTSVNLGSSTGKNTRDMAEEASELELYYFNFVVFSAAVHSTWQHVGRFNVSRCEDPLHAHHFRPKVPVPEWDGHVLRVAMRTFCESLEKVARHYSGAAIELECAKLMAKGPDSSLNDTPSNGQ